jgi:hypothetical protein
MASWKGVAERLVPSLYFDHEKGSFFDSNDIGLEFTSEPVLR